MSTDNFDEIIKKYSEELLEMGNKYGGEPVGEIAENAPETPDKDISQEVTTTSENEEKPLKEAETEEKEVENNEFDEESANQVPLVAFPEGDADSSADFIARVFTGEGAYPVGNAKVVVYRGDNIYAFLQTDSDGSTAKVKLPAFLEENSLEPYSKEKSLDYYADVFASGFITQKALLVSAVGGSEIVLDVLLVPEEELIG